MAGRPLLGQRRSTSSIHLSSRSDTDEGGLGDYGQHHNSNHHQSPGAPRKQNKQFVAHTGRHHGRVPSYGRNLNKLSKLTQTMSHGDLVAIAKAAAAQGRQSQSTSPAIPKAKEALNKRHTIDGNNLKRRSLSKDKPVKTALKKIQLDRRSSAPSDLTEARQKEIEIQEAKEEATRVQTKEEKDVENEYEDEEDVDDSGSDGVLEVKTTTLKKRPQEAPNMSEVSAQAAQPSQHPEIPNTNYSKIQYGTTSTGIRFTDNKQVNNNRANDPQVQAEARKLDTKDTLRLNTTMPQKPPETKSKITFGPPPTKQNKPVDEDNIGSPQAIYPKTPQATTHQENLPAPLNFLQHAKQPSKAPPQISAETATAYTEPRSSSTQTGSISNREQPLTSRFIISSTPSQSHSFSISSTNATPIKHSFRSDVATPSATPPTGPNSVPEHTYGITPPDSQIPNQPQYTPKRTQPNRTQAKLLLQRQSSQFEIANDQSLNQSLSHKTSQPALNGTQRVEVVGIPSNLNDRVMREYINVRRFVSPISDAVNRLQRHIKQNRIPSQRRSLERDGSGAGSLGLSQSLGAERAKTVRAGVDVGAGGSRDDSGIDHRRGMGKMDEAQIREVLLQVWSRNGQASADLAAS